MLPLLMRGPDAAPLRLLVLGAHPDDAEIGCAGTILKLAGEGAISALCWVVLTGEGARAEEAKASAEALLDRVPDKQIVLGGFRDGFLPYSGTVVKDFFEELK